MTSKILVYNQTQLEKWWNDYRKSMLGWAYLDKPSPVVLTTYYAKMVVEGDIPAGKNVILACKRHLKDLDRQGDEDFPWIFDEEKAQAY